MLIYLLLAVLPLQNLDSSFFLVRQHARDTIINKATPAEISAELKKKISLEARKSLIHCLKELQKRECKQQLANLVYGRKSTLPGWKEFQDIAGKGKESRLTYASLWKSSSEDIIAFLGAENPKAYAQWFIHNLSYIEENDNRVAVFFAAHTKHRTGMLKTTICQSSEFCEYCGTPREKTDPSEVCKVLMKIRTNLINGEN